MALLSWDRWRFDSLTIRDLAGNGHPQAHPPETLDKLGELTGPQASAFGMPSVPLLVAIRHRQLNVRCYGLVSAAK
jgi:hypothetical protein